LQGNGGTAEQLQLATFEVAQAAQSAPVFANAYTIHEFGLQTF
jgi:hypothetical protein